MNPRCRRCGECCKSVLLAFSPSQLKQSYNAWRKNKEQFIKLKDIDIIYPMLAGNCLGKTSNRKDCRYVYSPCKHLSFRGSRTYCSIWDIRPDLCQNYPFYDHKQEVRMGPQSHRMNPGYIRGCGYNEDVKVGSLPSEFEAGKLKPLTKGEK